MRVIFHQCVPNLDPKSAEFDQLVVPADMNFEPKGDLGKLVLDRARAGWDDAMFVYLDSPILLGVAIPMEGFGVARDSLIIAPLPDGRQDGDSELITQCFFKSLRCAGAIHRGIRKTSVAFSFWDIGLLGLSEDMVMHAVWRAIMEYREAFPYFQNDSALDEVHIYHSADCGAAHLYKNRVSQAFFAAPDQWGLRGDAYLWCLLMHRFNDAKYDGIDLYGFVAETKRAIEEICREPLSYDMRAFVKEPSHGGMSSGQVCGAFWAEFGIPYLCHLLYTLGLDNMPYPKIMADVEYKWGSEVHRLRLPGAILRDLQALRKRRRIIGIEFNQTGAFGHRYFINSENYCSVFPPTLFSRNIRVAGFGKRWQASFYRDDDDPGFQRHQSSCDASGLRAVVCDENSREEVFTLSATGLKAYRIAWRGWDNSISVRDENGEMCFYNRNDKMLARMKSYSRESAPPFPLKVSPECFNPDDDRVICTIDFFDATDPRLVLAFCAFKMLCSVIKGK